jgi:hypothetical protein
MGLCEGRSWTMNDVDQIQSTSGRLELGAMSY